MTEAVTRQAAVKVTVVKVAVVGVATEVGKTWVTTRVLDDLRSSGLEVAARKPAQSFDEADRGTTDAELLAAATGEEPTTVCPPHRWYPVPMAPPMAAEFLGLLPFTVADLVEEIARSATADVVMIETAGGVRSPIADDGDCVEFVRRIEPDLVLLVADAGLGTINSVRLSVEAFGDVRPLVFLNRSDPADDLHRRNWRWLAERDGLTVVTDIASVSEWVRAALR